MPFKKQGAKSQLILEGPLLKVIGVLSAPLILNNFILTFYNVADGLYVAQLSSTAFAATSFVWPVLYLFIAMGQGLSIAGNSILSQLLGGQHRERANQYARQMVVLFMVLGFLFSIIGYVISPPVISSMGAKGSFYTMSTRYLQINYVGLLFDLIFFSSQAILNAQGNTKTTTMISIATSIVNIVLDPFLIFSSFHFLGVNFQGLGLGIDGAGWATVIAKVLAAIMGLLAIFFVSEDITIHFQGFRPKTSMMKHILLTGIPTSVGQSGATMGFVVLNGFVQSYGTDTLAAYAMVNRVTQLMTQPAMGFGAALTSIIGQNYGARQFKRVKEAFQKTAFIVLGVSAFGSLMIFLFREPLLHLFIKEKDNLSLVAQATEYMNFSIFIVFFMGLFAVYQGLFQGMGFMKYSMYMSLLRLWLVRIPMVVLFKHFTNLGPTGIWISMLISNLVCILYAHSLYHNKEFQLKEHLI